MRNPIPSPTARAALLAAVVCSALLAHQPTLAADTAASQIAGWTAQARAANPAFEPSTARGAQFYGQVHSVTPGLQSCAACHGPAPTAAGRHAITGKPIQPLAPSANAERFSDAAKTEKWFRRNCTEVIGRECSPAEKADYVSWLLKGSK